MIKVTRQQSLRVLIISMFEYAKNYLDSGHSYITFNIDERTVKSSQFEEIYDFGKTSQSLIEDIIL